MGFDLKSNIICCKKEGLKGYFVTSFCQKFHFKGFSSFFPFSRYFDLFFSDLQKNIGSYNSCSWFNLISQCIFDLNGGYYQKHKYVMYLAFAKQAPGTNIGRGSVSLIQIYRCGLHEGLELV